MENPPIPQNNEEKETSSIETPSWVRKAAMAVGLAAASTGALATEHHVENPDKPGDKVEAVHSINKEAVKEIAVPLKIAWNDYIDFLETEGLRGSHLLDHKKKSDEMINKFRELHLGTPLNTSVIHLIQRYFQAFRLQRIEEIKKEIKQGKNVQMEDGISVDDVMKNVSPEDDIAGAETTTYKFAMNEKDIHYSDAVKIHLDKTNKNLEYTANKKEEKHVAFATLPTQDNERK